MSGALALCSGAQRAWAADAEGNAGASISLGGDSAASASGSAEGAAPAADTAPKEEPVDPRVLHPPNYEFAFVSVGAYQNWSLVGSVLYFGAGGSIGPPLYRYSKIGSNSAGWDPDLEILSGSVYLRFSPIKYLDLDVGPKIALGSALFNVPDPPQSSFSYGGYVDLRVGSKNIKLGPRFEFDQVAHSDFTEHGWRITPLLVRVMH